MPTINQRISDNLIASTSMNPLLVPDLNVPAVKGPIEAPVTLDQIADNIMTDLPLTKADTSFARPSMFAHVNSFAENVTMALSSLTPTKFAALSSQAKWDFAEWQGMVAAVALRHLFSATGLELTICTVALSSKNVMDRCVLMAMSKDRVYRNAVNLDANGNPASGHIYYLCQKGKPFAIFHPDVWLCPMKSYDSSIFEGVLSWYHRDLEDCHKGWDMLVQPGMPARMDDVCLSRIAWWAVQNRKPAFATFVTNSQRDPDKVCPNAMAHPSVMDHAMDIDNYWPSFGTSFGTALAYNLNLQPIPLLFSERILVTYTGGMGQNKMIYNASAGEKNVEFSGNFPDLEAFAPVPPFLQESMDLFESCSIQKLTFEPVVAGGNLSSIQVTLTVVNGNNESLTLRKYYNSDRICQGLVPYLMIWPYLPLPRNLWKEYHATWHDQAVAGINLLKGESGNSLSLISGLNFNFGAQGEVDKVFRITKEKEPWTVCTNTEPFRYATLVDGAGQNVGLIFIPKYEEPQLVTADFVLSVDFGTTSTVCALKGGALQDPIKHTLETPLEFLDYSRVITCEEPSAKQNVDMQHWLGNSGPSLNPNSDKWSWNKKLFSVAQLFGRNDDGINNGMNSHLQPGMQQNWRDGRLFLATGAAMAQFSGVGGGGHDPLRTQKIMNDMKFGGNLDIMNTHAATLFLAGIYSYAVLYLLQNGYNPRITIRASYPNDATKSALTANWSAAKSVLSNIMDSSLTAPIGDPAKMKYYHEAAATAAYHLGPANPLAGVTSLITADIGGGTTDISITNRLKQGELGELSFRYAGREVMVTSLIEYFRRFHSGSAIVRGNAMTSLWNQTNTNTVLLNQFDGICKLNDGLGDPRMFLRNLPDNSSLRMSVELLLADGMHMEKINVDHSTPMLRQLIALKTLMILRIVARSVANNYEVLLGSNKRLEVHGGRLDLNLSVTGASAQMMQYVLDCSINQLGGFVRRENSTEPIDVCMWLFEQVFDQELADVLRNPGVTGSEDPVTTRLHIYVDSNVKDKKEVCYGMLDDASLSQLGQDVTAAPAVVQGTGLVVPGPVLPGPGVGAPVPVHGVHPAPNMVQNAPMTAVQREKKVNQMRIHLMQYPEEKLQAYLYGEYLEDGTYRYGLCNYIQAYENNLFGSVPKANRGLGDQVMSVSDLLKPENYDRYFTECRTLMAQKRAAYMVENAQEDYRDLLACMYLVEELLNAEMAEEQMN